MLRKPTRHLSPGVGWSSPDQTVITLLTGSWPPVPPSTLLLQPGINNLNNKKLWDNNVTCNQQQQNKCIHFLQSSAFLVCILAVFNNTLSWMKYTNVRFFIIIHLHGSAWSSLLGFWQWTVLPHPGCWSVLPQTSPSSSNNLNVGPRLDLLHDWTFIVIQW